MSAGADPFASIATPVAKDDPFASIAQDPGSTTPPATPGALKRFASSYATGAGVTSNEEAKSFFRHPLDTLKGINQAQAELGAQAGRELKSGDYVRGLTHGVEYLIPGLGPTLAKAGTQLESGDIAGGVGTTLGAGTTVALTPESAKGGLSKVGQLRTAAREGRLQPFARKVTGVEPAVREAVTKAAEKQGTALTEHAAQAENVAQRGELAKTVDTKSHELGKHLEKVEASVGKEANAKFQAVREKIGNPEIPPDDLVATVRTVERDILQEIPENIKEFRAIISHGGEASEGLGEAFREATGEEPMGGKPISWDKLQSIKSRIDARLRSRTRMNGDLKRALYQTRDGVVGEMGKMAEANGAKAEWANARDFWRQYKEDFHEPTGPSGSGSPIAQALDAVDPKNIRQPFLRTQSAIGNRGTEILRKYPQHGGTEAAALADEVVGHHQALQDMPNKPKGFSPDKPPAAPVVDATKVARDAIATRAKNWGSFNARDIGILTASSIGGLLEHILSGRGGYELPIASVTYEGGKYAASRLLNKPSVVEWLSRTPPAEIEALNKIPGADRVKIATGITDAAVKAGRPVQLSPAARSFLGPANVARILAISAASNQVKTPGEARDRLRTVAPTP